MLQLRAQQICRRLDCVTNTAVGLPWAFSSSGPSRVLSVRQSRLHCTRDFSWAARWGMCMHVHAALSSRDRGFQTRRQMRCSRRGHVDVANHRQRAHEFLSASAAEVHWHGIGLACFRGYSAASSVKYFEFSCQTNMNGAVSLLQRNNGMVKYSIERQSLWHSRALHQNVTTLSSSSGPLYL